MNDRQAPAPTTAAAAPRGADEAWSAWMRRRLGRHLPELLRLSIPAILSRLGMLALGMVDTIMVGRYATFDLAALTLASQSLVNILLLTGIGLLLGVMTHVARAKGAGDLVDVGRIFRRNLPYAFMVGMLMVLLCSLARPIFQLLGQPAALIDQALPMVYVLAAGLPAHLLFFVAAATMEGIKRPTLMVYVLLIGNGLNVILNYALIHGWGPVWEMGGLGSAWATTILRWLGAAFMLGYVFFSKSMVPYQIRRRPPDHWHEWAEQRRVGYASAISMGAEVAAFGALPLVAALISVQAVAAIGIAFNIMTISFMAAAGIGAAVAVRVSVAAGRRDRDDTLLAGMTGLGFSWALIIPMGLLLWLFPDAIFRIYTTDPELLAITIPLAALIFLLIPFDGGQYVMSMGLRGLGDSWWPTAIQIICFGCVMIPLCVVLGVRIGTAGLLVATFIASILSLLLLSSRFLRVCWRIQPKENPSTRANPPTA